MVNPWILSHHESQINPNDWLATAALPRWYLKYFSEASNNGPVEAFYASYMPDVQRANKLDLIQPKDTWVLAKRNPPGRASLNKIHKPFLASMLFSKVHIVDGIYILRFILCGCVCMQLRTQICKRASKDEYVFAYAYIWLHIDGNVKKNYVQVTQGMFPWSHVAGGHMHTRLQEPLGEGKWDSEAQWCFFFY